MLQLAACQSATDHHSAEAALRGRHSLQHHLAPAHAAAPLTTALIVLACMHCCKCFLQIPCHSMPVLPVRPGTSFAVRHTGLALYSHCLKVQVITAYLMSSEQLGAEAALFSLLKSAPWVHPNEGFLRQVGALPHVAQQERGSQVQGLDRLG